MDEINQMLPDSPALQDQIKELRERAAKDSLSGLLNRLTAEQYIKKRLAALGPDELCAMMIIDLDNFKQVNDTLGHLAGDQAIRQCAQVLSGMFRANDIVGRLGGDEFIVFLAGKLTEESIRDKGAEVCQRLQITLGDSPGLTLTVSVGIRIASGGNLRFENMYQSADLAMYKAKKNGKHGCYIKREDAGAGEFLPVNTIPVTRLLEHMESGLALLEIGQELRIIYVSPSFFRIIGMEMDRTELPCPMTRIVHPDDVADLERTLRAGLESNQVVNHTHRVSSDGKNWMWWNIRAYRIEYDSPAPVMLVTTTDVSAFKERELRLQEANQRLRTAFEQTAQNLWEVDIDSRTMTIFRREDSAGSAQVLQAEFPQGLMDDGWVHPDSVPRFREFARELLEGRMQGYGNFILQHQDTGYYGWAAMSYRMICEEGGRPVRAVGILEYLPQEFGGQEVKAILMRPLPQALAPYLILGMQANLTRDTVRNLWVEGKNLAGRAGEESCGQILRKEEEKIFTLDDRQSMDDYFHREKLLKFFQQGERWARLEYRRVDGGGNIRWVEGIINLVEAPLTQDVFLFFYLVEYDRHRRWEQELEGGVEREPSNGLYDVRTTQALINARMQEAANGEHALAVLQMGSREWLQEQSGVGRRSNGYYIAAALTVALGPMCILGLHSRGEIVAFFPEIRSRERVKKALEEAFAFARFSLADILSLEHMRFVAGMVCTGAERGSFSAMAFQGRQLCQLWQNTPADTVALHQDDEDWAWDELQRFRVDDQITVHHTEMDRPLSEGEKDVALRCVSAMLSAENMDASIRSVLSYIGAYYRADRVYVLTLAENRHVVTMPYEWISQKKHSIQQAVSGLMLDRFPMLRRCLKERAPIFLTRSRTDGESVDCGPWHFTALPLIEVERVIGFLCIENSQEHPADAALFGALIPHIIREQKRFHARLQMPGEPSSVFLSEMPNLRSYMNVIYSLNSELYSSLGAVCLDIPGLSAINSSLGFEYGSKLLWYVSKTLTEIFGRDFLFRTWDAEFVVLCPDTTRPVFVGRCTRLRTTLQRRYPKRLRIGYTWSEGVFTGKSLVNEARSIMRCERVEEIPQAGTMAGSAAPDTDEIIQMNQFVLYLQPKVHMPTGTLLGAEVLVRGVDRSGGLIMPDRFIGDMEKNATIRDLDLYVMDHTMALLDRWREQGRSPIPLSVNFSRRTLFDPTAPASVLAIQSRYPLVPPEQLEVEITESGVGADFRSLAEVLDRFREFGLRFSLDDFGSEYANISIFTNVKFDSVKLDRSLIAQLPGNPKGQMLIRDLVRICHASGMICVAEGVENRTQIAALTQAGCGYGQGYYFDRPLPIAEFEKKYLNQTTPQ